MNSCLASAVQVGMGVPDGGTSPITPGGRCLGAWEPGRGLAWQEARKGRVTERGGSQAGEGSVLKVVLRSLDFILEIGVWK